MKHRRHRNNPSYEITFDGDRPVLQHYSEEGADTPRGARGRFLPRAPRANPTHGKKARKNPPLYGPTYGYYGKQPPPESYLGDLLDTGRLQISKYPNPYSEPGVPQMVTELAIPDPSEIKLRYFDSPSPNHQPEFIISHPSRTLLRTKSSQTAAATMRQLVEEEAQRMVRNRRFWTGVGAVALVGTVGYFGLKGRQGT